MTRKDFELIAHAFRDVRIQDVNNVTRAAYNAGITSAAWTMSDRLAAEYPRFQRDLFLEACGVVR